MPRLPSLLVPDQMDLFALPVAVIAITSVETLPTIPGRRARHEPRGTIYNLAEYFDTINRVIFKGGLVPVTLRWSRNRWKNTLGLCDVKTRVITLNTCLDDARVPDLVVAAIMHHEMLHLYLGISEGPNGGRMFHTPQFRAAEKVFPGFEASENWISANWPLRGRPAKKSRPAECRFLQYLKSIDPSGITSPASKSPDPVQSPIVELPGH